MSPDIKLFFKYIVPSITGMLIAGSFSIVDTVFIGRGMGENGLAAVAITWPLAMLIWGVAGLIASGAAVAISQARGAGREVSAQKIFGNMFLLEAAASIILCVSCIAFLDDILILFRATPEMMPQARDYAKITIYGAPACMLMCTALEIVRNDGRPALSMLILVAGLLANVFFDWLFIIVWNGQGIGAAAATVVSQAISGAIGIAYFSSKFTKLKISRKNLCFNLAASKKILSIGFPIFGNSFSIIAMLFMHNFQSLRYGGIEGLAAYTAVAVLESLGSMLMTGLAAGVQPIVALKYGSGDFIAQNRFGNYGYVTSLIFGIALMCISFLLRNDVPAWIGLNGDTARLAAHGVLMSSTAFILLGLIRVGSFYYQSTGKILNSSILIYGDAFVALPLCLFTLPIWFGMDGIWLAMPISRLILFAVLFKMWFYKRQKNIPNFRSGY